MYSFIVRVRFQMLRRVFNGLEHFSVVLLYGPKKKNQRVRGGLDLSNGEVTFSNSNYLQQLAQIARQHLHRLHGKLILHAQNHFKGKSRQILLYAVRKITKAHVSFGLDQCGSVCFSCSEV